MPYNMYCSALGQQEAAPSSNEQLLGTPIWSEDWLSTNRLFTRLESLALSQEGFVVVMCYICLFVYHANIWQTQPSQ